MQTSTIFALSSGALPSGVAVVRVSGPDSRRAIEALCGALPEPRKLAVRKLAAADGSLLDRGFVAFFPGPASFTGEDCAEFHVHGSRAVVAALLAQLGSLAGFRQAEAGEFARRAFVNGKLDLTEAEALSDLIVAETEAQRRLAAANASGRQRVLYEGWRARLLHARAMIEAELDFADEGDVPGSVAAQVWEDLGKLQVEIGRHLSGSEAAEVVREGFKVAILGAPNAGKSSLINRLAMRDVAIVSDEPGTTRDLIEVAMDIGGAKIVVTDTAGIRAGAGRVEAMGIERARQAAAEADLVLALEDMADPVDFDLPLEVPVLRVGTKGDLVAGPDGAYDVAISAATGAGIDILLAEIARRARERSVPAEAGIVPTRQRHVELLRAAEAALSEALDPAPGLELRAESLRVASTEIGRVSGSVDVEDMLDLIFSEFCIGK